MPTSGFSIKYREEAFGRAVLDLQHQSGGRDVVPAPGGLVHLGAHQHGRHADLVVVLMPAADRPTLLQGDALAALLAADGERVIHDEARLAGVDVRGAADVAVGRERGLGGGRHGVLPLGAPGHDHGLEGQRVDVQPGQPPAHGAATAPIGVLVALVEEAVELPHLVQHGGHAGVGVREHGDVGALQQAEYVGKLLLIHSQGVGLEEQGIQYQ